MARPEWAHPSDNFGAILAVADFLDADDNPLFVRDVLTTAIKAYEIQGVLALDNSFHRVGLDHVILVKAASTAVATNRELANKTTVIFPPWGSEHMTLGVWSRFAIASGMRNQKEAKDFLRWLLSGDRLYRYDEVLPGHMIPPLRSVRALPLDTLPYAQRHSAWIQKFYDWSDFANHPAMNLGSVCQAKFKCSDIVPPWSNQVFGTPGVIDSMLHRVLSENQDAADAWRDAVRQLEQISAAWQNTHAERLATLCH